MSENQEPGGDAPDVTDLTDQIERLNAKNNELLGKLKVSKQKLGVYDGIDPEKYAELMDAAEKAEADKAKAANDWDRREATWKAKLDAAEMANAEITRKFTDARRGEAASAAIAKHGGAEALLKHTVMNALQVDDEMGVYAEVDGDRMTPAEFVAKLAENDEYARAFPGTGASGLGSEGSRGKGGTPKVQGITFLK